MYSWSRSESFLEIPVFRFSPCAGQIIVQLERLVDFDNEFPIYHFRRQHFLQQFVTVPDGDLELPGELVHAQIVGGHDSGTNLPEGKTKAIGWRWG